MELWLRMSTVSSKIQGRLLVKSSLLNDGFSCDEENDEGDIDTSLICEKNMTEYEEQLDLATETENANEKKVT